MNLFVINGNALQIPLADKSVNMVVTSPPYYGLRNYNVDGQIGLEESMQDYINNIVLVFREVWRVMKDDGTLWLNLGDSYAGNNSQASNNGRAGFGNPREKVVNRTGDGLKSKDLIGIPWRVAFALQADGWYLRSDIIWHKPNPMPESVKDRPTKSHEYIFLLSKSQRYYYDYEAIMELSEWAEFDKRADGNGKHLSGGKSKENLYATNGISYGKKYSDGKYYRNKRSVWTVTTKPYKGAHFATFPQDLIIPCIQAGSKLGGLVLDPFNGSGTTGEVCARLGRDYVGVELNREYIGLTNERLMQYKIQPELI
jgi:DNA modification methylase